MHQLSHSMVAAAAVVVHRRTGQDRVTVAVGDGAVTVDVADDPPFATVTERVEAAVLEPDEEREPDIVLDLTDHGLRAEIEAALAAAPDTVVSRLPLVADDAIAEHARHGEYGEPTTSLRVHDLVLAQAKRTPDAIAVHGCERLTYRELDLRSGRLAAALSAMGVGPGAVAGVLLHRSEHLIVTLLAVLRTGAAYLALEPDDHPGRLARLTEDARATLVITEPSLRDRLPGDVKTYVPQESDAEPGVPARDGSGEQLAYISYTSGSTGEPKGVAVPHRAVVRLVHRPDWLQVRAEDVFLQLAPVAFDAATLEIWAPLVHGAELAVHPPGKIDTGDLALTLKEKRVSVLWLTAGLFHQMVAEHLDAFTGVRHVLAGGDVVAPESVHALMTAHPGLTFTNGFGPTENTTFTTCWTSAEPPTAGASVPIGTAIGGTGTLVLDPDLRPVPVGVRGELYATGLGLAHGYRDRPGATAERFVPCPYAGHGGRMYRTGDLVRRLPSGDLEFLGRVDQQVKIQGYRVEPGAVETELVRDPRVRQAVVLPQADGNGGKRLLAYVTLKTPDDDPGDTSVRLREMLAGVLPGYLVPWAIVVRDDLPLNRNGKVDRAALPTAQRVSRNVWNAYVPPRTSLEARIADVWGSVLDIEPIGVEDEFFDLGGHSLLAVDLIESMNARLGVNMESRMLYLHPTIAELAGRLSLLPPPAASREEPQS